MCLAIPGRVVAVDERDPAARSASVDFEGVVRTASLIYTPEVRTGDYVIVQAGFALRVIPEPEAREALDHARRTVVGGAGRPEVGALP